LSLLAVIALIALFTTRRIPARQPLCDHHYCASQGALQAADATVYDHEGVLIMGTVGRSQPHRHQPPLRRSDSQPSEKTIYPERARGTRSANVLSAGKKSPVEGSRW